MNVFPLLLFTAALLLPSFGTAQVKQLADYPDKAYSFAMFVGYIEKASVTQSLCAPFVPKAKLQSTM